jgi:hypothetical protein
MGRTREAESLLSQLVKLSKTRYVSSLTLALVYIGLKRIDAALQCGGAYKMMMALLR